MMRTPRMIAVLATAFVVACVLAPGTAQAGSFRYWTYWTGQDDAWVFSPVGPAGRHPADGTVEGWRFAVTGVTASAAPGIAPAFDDVCAGTQPAAGHKRVALIVDPGTGDDAPEGERPPGAWALCVVADPDASGFDILRSATTVRTDRGLICSLDDYPAHECAVSVGAPHPTPDPKPTSAPTHDPTHAPKPDPTPTPDPKPTNTGAASDAPTPEPPAPSPTPSARATTTSAATATPAPSAPVTSSSPAPASSPAPPSSPAPSTEPASPVATPASATITPTPSTSYSLLAAPLLPPDDDSSSTAALIVVLALAAIGALGFAALVRGRGGSA